MLPPRDVPYNTGMAMATSMRELAAGAHRCRELYREDPWTWSREQVAAMERRDFDAIDWEHVIEEIGDVAGRDEAAWFSYCKNVLSHMLKIEHSDRRETVGHWRKEIVDWRLEMYVKLVQCPGMKARLSELLGQAWMGARVRAVQDLAEHASPKDWTAEKALRRTWRRRLPEECPYILLDVSGYDPFDKNDEPQPEVWPPSVARALNEALGTDYPVRYRERGGGR